MNRGAPPPRQRREAGALTIVSTTQRTEQEGKTHTVMPTRQRPRQRECFVQNTGTNAHKRATFPLPSPTSRTKIVGNKSLHTVRSTRAYVRALQLVFFFRLHLFTRPLQVIRNQRTMGEDFAIFSFTSFFCKRQNRKRRKTTVISTKQKHVNCRFSSVALAVKENAQILHPKHSIVQLVTHTR